MLAGLQGKLEQAAAQATVNYAHEQLQVRKSAKALFLGHKLLLKIFSIGLDFAKKSIKLRTCLASSSSSVSFLNIER